MFKRRTCEKMNDIIFGQVAKKKKHRKRNKAVHEIACVECGKTVMKTMSNARFCSDACRAKNDRDKKRSLLPEVVKCAGCQKTFSVAELMWFKTNVKTFGLPMKSEHFFCKECGKEKRLQEARKQAVLLRKKLLEEEPVNHKGLFDT